jgi:hypothetical protein
VLSVLLLLFKCEVPKIPLEMICGGVVRAWFDPIIICLWEKSPKEVMEKQQWTLYPFLPAMCDPSVELLLRAVQELEEHDDREAFKRHLAWFQTMLRRTTTVNSEDKQKIREVIKMQYQGFELFREDPVIGGMILEGELKGELKGELRGKIEGRKEGEIDGLREAIIDIVNDLFSSGVGTLVQQTINTSQDKEQLRKFHRQLFAVSDEQEVLKLLNQYFIPASEWSESSDLEEAIVEIVSDRFSSEIVERVREVLAVHWDRQQVRKFLRKLFGVSKEEEVLALVAECFPVS